MSSRYSLGQPPALAEHGSRHLEALSNEPGGVSPPPLMDLGLLSVSAPLPPPLGHLWSGKAARPQSLKNKSSPGLTQKGRGCCCGHSSQRL